MAGEIKFNIDSRWEGDLEEGLDPVIETVRDAFRLGLGVLRGTAKDLLEEHIYRDVYEAFGEPKDYHRRKGAGLLDLDNSIQWTGGEGWDRTGCAAQATMLYTPHGDSPQWEQPAFGDRMIDRIENNKDYEWEIDVGERPYWTNFVRHMLDQTNGFAEAGLRAADDLRAMGMTVDYDGINEIIESGEEGKYARY